MNKMEKEQKDIVLVLIIAFSIILLSTIYYITWDYTNFALKKRMDKIEKRVEAIESQNE